MKRKAARGWIWIISNVFSLIGGEKPQTPLSAYFPWGVFSVSTCWVCFVFTWRCSGAIGCPSPYGEPFGWEDSIRHLQRTASQNKLERCCLVQILILWHRTSQWGHRLKANLAKSSCGALFNFTSGLLERWMWVGFCFMDMFVCIVF